MSRAQKGIETENETNYTVKLKNFRGKENCGASVKFYLFFLFLNFKLSFSQVLDSGFLQSIQIIFYI